MIPTPLLLLLVLALPFLRPTHAAIRPPQGRSQVQARFNCPDVPVPGFFTVDRTHYPRLYPACADFGCDCGPDPRDRRGVRYQVVCHGIEFLGEPLEEEDEIFLRLCLNTCSCYGGATGNFVRWPDGPGPVGPVLRNGSGVG